VALARERHFARAAEACGIAQPTLSAALKQLEADLGAPVVERGNRFKGLTPEGQRVLAWAQRILADCDALQQELAAARGGLEGRLTIGVIPTALPLAAWLTAAVRDAHPGVGFGVVSRTSAEIQRGLDGFELHAGLTYLENEPLVRVRARKLGEERYVLLSPAGGPPRGRAGIAWAEAAALPLCLLVPEMQNRRIVDAAFRAAGRVPRPVVETDAITALLAHVRHAGLHAVAPEGLIERIGAAGAGIAALPLVEPEVAHAVGLVVADRSPLPLLVEALWERAGAAVQGA
jgi:DNA-binding transcriptional LysR family regulator